VPGRGDRVALRAEQIGEKLHVVRRVVDDEHLRFDRGHSRWRSSIVARVDEFLEVDRLADVAVEARLR
jgi:hypothetical protein